MFVHRASLICKFFVFDYWKYLRSAYLIYFNAIGSFKEEEILRLLPFDFVHKLCSPFALGERKQFGKE